MRIVFDDHIKLYEVLQGLHDYTGEELEISVPQGSVFAEYPSNIVFLRKVAQRLGKKVKVEGESPVPTSSAVATAPSLAVPNVSAKTEDLDSSEEVAPEHVEADISAAKKARGVTPKKILISLGILLVLGLIGAGAFVFYYLPRGTVVLYVAENLIERSGTVTVDTKTQSVDETAATIPGHAITASIEASESFAATGKKQVGEKASGKVVIQNYSEDNIQLAAGALLRSINTETPLDFTLAESVTVEKSKVSEGEDNNLIVKPGESKAVTINAKDIGDKYNLAAKTQFSVAAFPTGGLSRVIASNAEALSGGSTKEVLIVSADDQKNAQAQLMTKIKADAPGKLDEQLKDNEAFSEATIGYETKFADFSQAVGVEAEKFALTLKVNASAIAYNEEDVKTILKKDVADNVPDGFELAPGDELVSVEKVESATADKITVKAKIASVVTPKIDTDNIERQIIGMRPSQAEEVLRGIQHVDGYDLRIWPTLPDAFRTLPHQDDRLEVKIEVKDGTEQESTDTGN